jgi:radical SAM enzyme (TIGR01210 family)
MSEVKFLSDQSSATEQVVLKACELALQEHAVNKSDLAAAFLFGSRVKGFAQLRSDIDLIFLLPANARGMDFQYRRLTLAKGRIDSNVIKISILNELCRNDADWAYRLHHARFIPELTSISGDVAACWEEKVDKLIESPMACRFRLIRHLRDCRSLLRAVQRFPNATAVYLLVEAIFLIPVIYLNARALVPYQAGQPWDEALALSDKENHAEARDYKHLVEIISRSFIFQELSRQDKFARELKRVRERCRISIESSCGDVFRSRQGAAVVSALAGNKVAQQRIAEFFPQEIPDVRELAQAASRWLTKARPPQQKLTGARHPTPRKAASRNEGGTPEPRFIHYYPDLERLKVIIPTGGCRVPTCTFCMLPLLARPKTDVMKTLSLLREATQGRVRQLAVYTDGSFFDDRELNELERTEIASFAKESGVEELLVESLPRFLKAEVLNKIYEELQPGCRLRIGVGVQSTEMPIRRHITSTPMSHRELMRLLELRASGMFSLRIFLMANKPLMSAAEDRQDLYRSLRFLQRYLVADDIVTINPLLPTHGTFLEGLWKTGYWRPLTLAGASALQTDLGSKDWGFHLEFGPSVASTCTDVHLEPKASASSTAPKQERPGAVETSACFLPWALLGGARQRRLWANNIIGKLL